MTRRTTSRSHDDDDDNNNIIQSWTTKSPPDEPLELATADTAATNKDNSTRSNLGDTTSIDMEGIGTKESTRESTSSSTGATPSVLLRHAKREPPSTLHLARKNDLTRPRQDMTQSETYNDDDGRGDAKKIASPHHHQQQNPPGAVAVRGLRRNKTDGTAATPPQADLQTISAQEGHQGEVAVRGLRRIKTDDTSTAMKECDVAHKQEESKVGVGGLRFMRQQAKMMHSQTSTTAQTPPPPQAGLRHNARPSKAAGRTTGGDDTNSELLSNNTEHVYSMIEEVLEGESLKSDSNKIKTAAGLRRNGHVAVVSVGRVIDQSDGDKEAETDMPSPIVQGELTSDHLLPGAFRHTPTTRRSANDYSHSIVGRMEEGAIGSSSCHDHDEDYADYAATTGVNSISSSTSDNSNDGLVTATLIADDEPSTRFAAEIVDTQAEVRRQHKHKRRVYISLGTMMMCCVVVVLIVVLSVVLTTKDHTATAPTVPPLTNLTLLPQDDDNNNPSGIILNLPMSLPESTLNAIHNDVNGTTFQFRAYKWLQEDPYLANYSHDEARLVQRFVAATFFYATNGDYWDDRGGGSNTETRPPVDSPMSTNYETDNNNNGTDDQQVVDTNLTHQEELAQWLSYGTHECSWFNTAPGIEEDEPFCGTDGLFLNFDISNNNLSGTIPEEIGLLKSLRSIKWGWSSLQGTLPTQLGLLTNLEELRIFRGLIRGPIPSELGLLSNTLVSISMIDSYHSGTLPTEIWQLSKLKDLAMNRNDISGTIPSDMCYKVPGLEKFRFMENRISGTLPTTLSLCTHLEIIDVAGNQVTGTIPSELGELVNMTTLELDSNDFSGWVPSELGMLTELQEFTLHSNKGIIGTLAEELTALGGELLVFNIAGTSLSGTIPEDVCGVDKLSFDCLGRLCGCECSC